MKGLKAIFFTFNFTNRLKLAIDPIGVNYLVNCYNPLLPHQNVEVTFVPFNAQAEEGILNWDDFLKWQLAELCLKNGPVGHRESGSSFNGKPEAGFAKGNGSS